MASNISSHTLPSQAKRTSFSGFPGTNASLFLDRTKAGIRGSTPDSEALASSDDEPDQLHRLQPVTSNPAPKPTRHTSWFTEGQQSIPRNSSLGGGPFSPVSPGTVTSSSDQAPWHTGLGSSTGSTMGRGHSNSASFPWGNTIWNSDAQKGPPQRLTEVLPSPTSLVPPGSSNLHEENPVRSPPLSRDHGTDPSIPFSIPLQPTLKSYRSQSYSVGQIDPEVTLPQSTTYGANTAYAGSRRGASYGGLHHRPSRPSMLGDLSHDLPHLGQLREVEDDEESSAGSGSGVQLHSNGSRTVQELVGENAILRQRLAAQQLQDVRQKQHGLTSTQRNRPTGQYYHQRLRDSIPGESESALYETDELERYDSQRSEGPNGRRFSEYGTRSGPHYALGVSAENKRGQWQSSLGFARVEEPPQSRRHSFAEMPTRHNSTGSTGESQVDPTMGDVSVRSKEHRQTPGYPDGLNRPPQGDNSESALSLIHDRLSAEIELSKVHLHARDFAVNYFSRTDPSPRNASDYHQPLSSSNLHQTYIQGQYPRSQHLSHPQNRLHQSLYIVTFKCLRADVFYIQEGTGLNIKKGDLVIVEADRGTDLGTVATDAVLWAEAKQAKDDYTKKHHEWLMAFSHHTQNGTVAGPNPNGPPLAHGATTSSSGQTGYHDVPSGELKPKLIKRLAQNHEITTLRDKEGAEAKAKRMCQQKVVDHRLSMEILDAEFQMDWKKLTFFYFADSYINFNPLVTDLFKVYKTRIWMSAINTAAIGSLAPGPRPLGMPLRSAVNHDLDDFPANQYTHPAATISTQAPMTAFDTMYGHSRNGGMLGGMTYDLYPQIQAFHAQGFDARHLSPFPMDYRPQSQQAVSIPSSFGNAVGYSPSSLHHASSFNSQPDSSHGGHHDPQMPGDWTQALQGLSLGRSKRLAYMVSQLHTVASRQQPLPDASDYDSPEYRRAKKPRPSKVSQQKSSQAKDMSNTKEDATQTMKVLPKATVKGSAKNDANAVTDFNSAIDGQGQTTLHTFEQRVSEITVMNDDLQRATWATLSLSSWLPELGVGQDLSAMVSDPQPIFQHAQRLMKSAKELLGQYNSMNEHIGAAKSLALSDTNLLKDVEKVKIILGKQAAKVKQEITVLLYGDHSITGKDDDDPDIAFEKDDVWTRFAGATSKSIEAGEPNVAGSWAVTAKRAERNVRKLMGALKYVEELQKKKQSDVLRFLLRVRCWELRQLNVVHRASRPSRPDKARRLGYKAKQGYVIYRIRVRRGGRKRPVPKGATYGKPTNQGVNQLKYQRSLKSTAEERVGRRCANLRVLNSYWINQDSTYKYFEVILVDPQHKAIRRDPRINWIVKAVHKHRESRGLTATGKKSRGLGKGHKFNKTTAGRRKTWKRHNTQSYWRYR
ncbi:MAG: hypothetical protein Q9217_002718 [Psora testacea]